MLTLNGNRLLVTPLLAVLIFGVFVFGGTYFYQYLLTDTMTTDTVETVFPTMIGAIITGVTLVLTITQIVISQENGPLGKQRDRMSDTIDFREYAEELTGFPAPSGPADFLRSIILESKEYAERLRESVSDNDDENFRGEVAEFTDGLVGMPTQYRTNWTDDDSAHMRLYLQRSTTTHFVYRTRCDDRETNPRDRPVHSA